MAPAGRSVTLMLTDEIDVARGDLLADPRAAARPSTRRFAADLVWMDEAPPLPGRRFLLKIGTAHRAGDDDRASSTRSTSIRCSERRPRRWR